MNGSITMNTNKIVSGTHQYTYGTSISGSGSLGLPLKNIYIITTTGTATVTLPTAGATYTGVIITFRRKAASSGIITFTQTGGGSLIPFNSSTVGTTTLSASQFSTSFTCDGTNWLQLQTI